MDALSVLALATQCATAAPAPVVAAVALAQTDGTPYAVTIAGVPKAAANADAAVQEVALALTNNVPVRIGIASVPVSAFEDRGISYTHGFSACSNLSIASNELSKSWRRFGGMQEHWRLAVLEYATGQAGVEGPFGEKFDTAMAKIKAVAPDLPDRQIATATATPVPVQPRSRPAEAETGAGSTVGWNVFRSDRSRSLLVYSK